MNKLRRYFHVFSILGLISYKDWELQLRLLRSGILHLQVTFSAFDFGKGEEGVQVGRAWPIHDEMSDSDIVATVFKAIMTAEEHETRESFRYRGQPIFGPHQDVDLLAALSIHKQALAEAALSLM